MELGFLDGFCLWIEYTCTNMCVYIYILIIYVYYMRIYVCIQTHSIYLDMIIYTNIPLSRFEMGVPATELNMSKLVRFSCPKILKEPLRHPDFPKNNGYPPVNET